MCQSVFLSGWLRICHCVISEWVVTHVSLCMSEWVVTHVYTARCAVAGEHGGVGYIRLVHRAPALHSLPAHQVVPSCGHVPVVQDGGETHVGLVGQQEGREDAVRESAPSTLLSSARVFEDHFL